MNVLYRGRKGFCKCNISKNKVDVILLYSNLFLRRKSRALSTNRSASNKERMLQAIPKFTSQSKTFFASVFQRSSGELKNDRCVICTMDLVLKNLAAFLIP